MSQITIISGNVYFHIYMMHEDAEQAVKNCSERKILLEAKQGQIGQYTYRIDPPHNSENGQQHVHVMLKGKELFALNRDGSAHDGWHGAEIPKKVYDKLPSLFPSLVLPSNRLIESVITKPNSDEEVAIWGDYIETCDSLKKRILLG